MNLAIHDAPWVLSWPTVVWTLSAVYGLFVGQRSVRAARNRHRHIAADPIDRAVADTHVRRESLRMGMQVGALFVGATASVHLQLFSPVWLLVGYQLVAVLNTRLDERALDRVREMHLRKLLEPS